ncbi:hypothetical protein DWV96_05300 [Phocaeicola vulgatus]|nr:hypothetical protein DWV96_05300 [Phocaeicola vulgatus]
MIHICFSLLYLKNAVSVYIKVKIRMNRVLNIGNMTNKNSYNIYISLGKRSIKYIAKIRKLLVISNKKQR